MNIPQDGECNERRKSVRDRAEEVGAHTAPEPFDGLKTKFINVINSERNALCKVWDKGDKYRQVLHTMGYGVYK